MSKGIKIDCASFLKVLGWVWSGWTRILMCTDKTIALDIRKPPP